MSVLSKDEEKKLLNSLDDTEVIEQSTSISWDGNNLILRLPKEISDYLGLNKANRFTKKILFRITEARGDVKREFEVIERKEPKRKTKKRKQENVK